MTTEIRDDVELEIEDLRKEKNAVILAHYYQQAEIQDLADYVGDSLSLSRIAAKCEQDVIVFCGVRFMAETAKILNPSRTVVLPDLEAGCSLVDGCPPAVVSWAVSRATSPVTFQVKPARCRAMRWTERWRGRQVYRMSC